MSEYDYASDNDSSEFDFFDSYGYDLGSMPPFGWDRNRINFVEINLSASILSLIEDVMNPYLSKIIEESRPVTNDAGDVSNDIEGNLESWRDNIFNALDDIKTMQEEGDHGESSVFSLRSREAQIRQNSIDFMNDELRELKDDFKEDKGDIKGGEDDFYDLPGLEPKLEKKWWQIFKEKSDAQKDLESIENRRMKDTRDDFRSDKRTIKLLRNYLENGVPMGTEIADLPNEYQSHFNTNNFRDSLNDLRGRLEGEVDDTRRFNDTNSFDPYEDFRIDMGDHPDIYFDFLGVDSIDDILPLFAPKAMTNVVDADKEGGSDPYAEIANLDSIIPTATELNAMINESGVQLDPIDESASLQDVQLFLMDLEDNQRARVLTLYRQKRYELITDGETSMDGTYIKQQGGATVTEESTSEVKDKWLEGQEESVENNLTELYSEAHNVYGTRGEEYDPSDGGERNGWLGHKGDQRQDTPNQNELGYDENGRATQQTVRNFAAWLKIFPPVGLQWNGTAFVPDSKAPLPTEDIEKNQEESTAYEQKVADARAWNERIGTYENGTAAVMGWEIDAEKLEILTDLSLTHINPQKWTNQAGSTSLQNWDDDKVKEFKSAGSINKDKPFNSVVSNDQKTGNILGTHSFGIYQKTEEVRYPKYDETTEETYEPDPNDPKFLSGIDRNIPGLASKYETKNLDNTPKEVDEIINWVINYKVKAFKRREIN